MTLLAIWSRLFSRRMIYDSSEVSFRTFFQFQFSWFHNSLKIIPSLKKNHSSFLKRGNLLHVQWLCPLNEWLMWPSRKGCSFLTFFLGSLICWHDLWSCQFGCCQPSMSLLLVSRLYSLCLAVIKVTSAVRSYLFRSVISHVIISTSRTNKRTMNWL